MIWWVILFLVAGMALVISEFFLPGAILGILGVMLVIVGAALGIYSYPEYGLFIIIGEFIGVAFCTAIGFFILTRTRAAKMLTLEHSQSKDAGYVSAASDLSLLNQEGVVLTALRPSGTIKVGQKRIDAVSNGVFVEEGARVRIVEVHGSRVVVDPLGIA
jgi:membrane-bound serine protease (ClpP class)